MIESYVPDITGTYTRVALCLPCFILAVFVLTLCAPRNPPSRQKVDYDLSHLRVPPQKPMLQWGIKLPREIAHRCYRYLEFSEVLSLNKLSRRHRRRISGMLRDLPWEARYHAKELWRYSRRDLNEEAYEWLTNMLAVAPRSRVLAMKGADALTVLFKATKAGFFLGVRAIVSAVPPEQINLRARVLPKYKPLCPRTYYTARTCLQEAVSRRERDIAKLLLSLDYVDADANPRDASPGYDWTDADVKFENGMTPLRLAVENIDIETVAMLLDRPEVDANAADVDGFTPFLRAVELGCVAIVDELTRRRRHSINVNAVTRRCGDSPLHIANRLFGEKGRTEIIALLLGLEGLDVNIRNREGLTPLRQALKLGDARTVVLLCKHPDVWSNLGDEPEAVRLRVAKIICASS